MECGFDRRAVVVEDFDERPKLGKDTGGRTFKPRGERGTVSIFDEPSKAHG